MQKIPNTIIFTEYSTSDSKINSNKLLGVINQLIEEINKLEKRVKELEYKVKP